MKSLLALYCSCGLTLLAGTAAAQTALPVSEPGTIALAPNASAALVETIRVRIRRSGGNPARDAAVIARLNLTLAQLQGRPFDKPLLDARMQAARAQMGAGAIEYRIADEQPGQSIALTVAVDTVDSTSLPAPGGPGFPVLYRSDRTLVTALLGGGLGLYSDINPWFGKPGAFIKGSPIAGRLPGRNPGWTEGFIEPGIAFITQIGERPLYVYGAATAIASWSLGQDIFRNDTRVIGRLEKAYAGILYVDPLTGASLNFSAGRQNVTLNDGFLIHFVRGSSNAGARGGLYLGPRNANDFSAVADVSVGRWTLKGFHIDPNELEFLESRSQFSGVNLRYALTPDISADASYIRITGSKTMFPNPAGASLPKSGINTYAGHVRWRNALGLRGLWIGTEVAFQNHSDRPMAAWAGYGLIGYRAAALPWTPSLSYRYATFSGDNPATRRYERFDPLLSTGLGNWLQGVTFGKTTSNSNLNVHRVQLNVAPSSRLNLTLDWHHLRAAQLNNLGSNAAISQLASRQLGQEFTLTARWAINRNLFLQSFVSHAMPGKALGAIGAGRPWTTLQASLYWTL